MKTTVLTVAAMVAFAANSLLCRIALLGGEIDPMSFATLRVGAGAAVLAAITLARGWRWRGNLGSASALAIYMVPFSLAYVSLAAGTGALILFGAVQVVMIASGLHRGERPHRREWGGLVVALVGLVVLSLPGFTRPPLAGAALMLAAGIAWGVYSLRGRTAGDPIAATSGNFLLALPLATVASLFTVGGAHASARGVVLALISGAFTSGLGYVAWYGALTSLSATRAATVQLTVPVLAAAGGLLLLDEAVTLRFVLAAALILGGVLLASRHADPP